MLRPSPNHGTQRLPNDDDDDLCSPVPMFPDYCTLIVDFSINRSLPAIAELGATLSGAAVAMTSDAQRIIR